MSTDCFYSKFIFFGILAHSLTSVNNCRRSGKALAKPRHFNHNQYLSKSTPNARLAFGTFRSRYTQPTI